MNVISIGVYLEFDNFETRGKMDRRRADGTSTGAIACHPPTREPDSIRGRSLVLPTNQDTN